uniref:Retrovirus-related Pol polyprotein from transposon TNT 1-94 n=1 Tax=Cajanus cajan TaxID=3821 RepID=A0A151QMF8_CAJCA|nr:Retrovirus-related Pol polyprotein from transposon TNT 1-94 [Cajanus cajan]
MKSAYTRTDSVNIGKGTGLHISHVGHSCFHNPMSSKHFVMHNLLHVPSITTNLFSVSKFARDNRVFFEFWPDCCNVKTQDTKDIILQGHLKDDLYVFPQFQKVQTVSAHPVQKDSNHSLFQLWHSRLGHPSPRIVKFALKHCNIPSIHFPDSFLCDSCCMGKAHQLPFVQSTTEYKSPIELVFTDIWGPSPVPSSTGARHYIIFLDAYSRYSWIYLLNSKSQAFDAFVQFKTSAELQLGMKVKALQSDNAKEYIKFTKYLTEHGIKHHFSCPHTHEQNGSPERKHRHIVETGLTLLTNASLPLHFLAEGFLTTTTLINYLPTPSLNKLSPHQTLFQTPPDYNFLKTFG